MNVAVDYMHANNIIVSVNAIAKIVNKQVNK